MHDSKREAKRRLMVNIASNVMFVAVNTGVGIWQTPYLIKHFGVAVYGMIPLVVSFIAYFNLFTSAIANATSRYVAICLDRGEKKLGNIYFNSALTSLVILCLILLVPLVVLSLFFSRLFQVPAGFESMLPGCFSM